MAASDETPGAMPGREDGVTPGKEMTVQQHMLDMGAHIMQSLSPINRISHHACSFAVYSHDMRRTIETHHFVSRLNQDFCQCAVYDSDHHSARLIGIEYIISDKVFGALPPEEQKLWHSHAYEIKSGLWVSPRVPGLIEKAELQTLAKTYGKFWCTWQTDRGDKLPLGAPALMVSPQEDNTVAPEMVKKRDEKYKISSESLMKSRAEIEPPDVLISYADYWKTCGKGFALDIHQTDIKPTVPFP